MLRSNVHIAPFGYEKDRIVKPAIESNAAEVVILAHPGDDSPDWYPEIRERLEDEGVDVTRNTCNIFDMYAVIQNISGIVSDRRGPDVDVMVNIATGSSISAIGGMIACMTTGAIPYYVEPEGYGDPDDEEIKPVSYGTGNMWKLTAYPMDGPSEQMVWIMEYIHQNDGVNKQELIDFGRGDAEVVPGYGPDERLKFMSEEYTDSAQSNMNRLNSHIIQPLLEHGWVKTEKVGNAVRLSLTERGKKTRQAFEHKMKS